MEKITFYKDDNELLQIYTDKIEIKVCDADYAVHPVPYGRMVSLIVAEESRDGMKQLDKLEFDRFHVSHLDGFQTSGWSYGSNFKNYKFVDFVDDNIVRLKKKIR